MGGGVPCGPMESQWSACHELIFIGGTSLCVCIALKSRTRVVTHQVVAVAQVGNCSQQKRALCATD